MEERKPLADAVRQEDKQPLAEAMRPGAMEEFIGQEQLKERLGALRKAGRLPSLLLYGPPGCGKSTLAMLLAKESGKKFLRVSAPEAGLSQLRRSLATADILILDELHRFSKAQQDFFLPLLESGELTLVATTTENPSFSVTRQLLSRLHVLRLRALGRPELREMAARAAKRIGLGLGDEALSLLVTHANGDGRALLNLVEYVAALPAVQREGKELKNVLPEAVARHDRDGDSHYELASALIKSIRGSDVDAALYYLACLVEGGEDPRFICRRLILSASEDVGLADPHALPMAVSCQQAVEFVGMPEGFIPMAETVAYLALARKSNSAYAAYLNAARELKITGRLRVPLHLRNAATALQKQWGYGKDYKYPHNYPESWVRQEYLPEEIADRKFYQPRNNGMEPALANWWRKISEAGKNDGGQ